MNLLKWLSRRDYHHFYKYWSQQQQRYWSISLAYFRPQNVDVFTRHFNKASPQVSQQRHPLADHLIKANLRHNLRQSHSSNPACNFNASQIQFKKNLKKSLSHFTRHLTKTSLPRFLNQAPSGHLIKANLRANLRHSHNFNPYL